MLLFLLIVAVGVNIAIIDFTFSKRNVRVNWLFVLSGSNVSYDYGSDPGFLP